MPKLARYYHDYLVDQDSAAFIRRVNKLYLPGTLERLAANPMREIRRAAVLALGFLGGYESNAVLGRALQDEDRGVRLAAENGIRAVWCRDGNESQQQMLAAVIRLNSTQQFKEAAQRASDLIEQAPAFAEAWNQRAIAYYSLGEYHHAIRDCREALEINPYHFGAAAGMGQCYVHLNDQRSALECFRRALRLNPNLEGVRANVVHLERILKSQS
jgi:tetratricopeptide (TPR) repeat protein